MSELSTFYARIVNKSLSVEVLYTGRFWLRNATKNNKCNSANE